MTKETATIIKAIASSEKAYREHLISLVFDLIDSALNRHNEDEGEIFLRRKVTLVKNTVSPRFLATFNYNIAEHIHYDKENHIIQVIGENENYEETIIGDFYTMPIGMVEEVVKAIVETAKSE